MGLCPFAGNYASVRSRIVRPGQAQQQLNIYAGAGYKTIPGKIRTGVKGGAFIDPALHLYVAFVLHHNLLAKAEAYAAPCFLCAEEGYEYFVEQFFGHAAAVVCNLDDDFIVGCVVCRE